MGRRRTELTHVGQQAPDGPQGLSHGVSGPSGATQSFRRSLGRLRRKHSRRDLISTVLTPRDGQVSSV